MWPLLKDDGDAVAAVNESRNPDTPRERKKRVLFKCENKGNRHTMQKNGNKKRKPDLN